MCVIMVANQGTRPTEEMVHLGWEANKFGGGVAWQEDGQVKWVKGLDEDQMQEYNKKLPFPYVLHFRIPSGGTSTLPGVCHPFPIEGKVSLSLKGASKTGVLFHNGFWTNWKDKLTTAAVNSRFRLPPGSWSDTRGLAWMTSHFGLGILELIDEKVIVITPKFIHTFGNGWNIENDVLVSNLSWKSKGTTTPYHMGQPASWQGRGRHNNQGSTGGDLGNVHGSFRGQGTGGADQRRLSSGETDQKKVEEGASESGSKVVEALVGSVVSSEVTTPPVVPSQGSWARGLNHNEFRTPASYPYHQDMKCSKCNTAKADIWERGSRRCWNCWELDNRAEKEAKAASPVALLTGKVRESTCNFCGVDKAQHRTLSTNEWMCNRCWINKQRPKLRKAEEEIIPLPQESGQIH